MAIHQSVYTIAVTIVFFMLVHMSSCEQLTDTEGPGASKGNFSCYECNSYYSPTCADFFNNRSWELMPCRPDQSRCRKVVQEAWYDGSWNVRYIRQCAQLGEVGYDEGRRCVDRIGTYRVKMRYCYCDNKDGCNGAQIITVSALIVTPMMLGLFRLLG